MEPGSGACAPGPGSFVLVNTHALSVLEFPAVLALVAQRASSPLGAARVRELAPVTERSWIEGEHARVAAMRALVNGEGGWHPEPIPELTAPLARLRALGSVWSGEELLGGARLLRSARLTREALADERRRSVATAVLAPFGNRLASARDAEAAIERAIDPDGTVRDDASPALRRVRRELRGAQGELVQLLERVMARLEPHQRVADMSVTVRNGRYVIPVRREARGAVGGIVHDESATRGTLFVEPPAAIEFGNRIRELEAEERREVERILLELTDTLRPLREPMMTSLDVLITLDALYARARYADEFECAPAELAAAGEGFVIRSGRHPLLLARGGAVVPFDLAMAAAERTLLLSGPNTGGKTVLLKAVGLISAMVQSGIPAPVGPESRVAVYDDCFADIGDEQSIEASLSTFSAHLRNLGEILARASAASLVLIDELGSGTDPAEGAALGDAILEELTRRGTLTVATTHLGQLKLLATEVPGVVNASLQFDEVALEPTYRLIKGIPGRSYGIGIARRLRLPSEVLARAEDRLSHGERDVAALLADLERREVELGEREARAAEALARATEGQKRADAREQRLREQERTLERRARQQARQFLLDARNEVERAIREIRDSAAAEEAARESRRRVEELASRQAEAIERIERREARPAARAAGRAAAEPEAIAPGDVVEVGTLGGRAGQVLELRGDEAVVAVGAIKLTVPVRSLSRTGRAAVAVEAVPLRGDLPEEHAPSEVDLRGMRVDEMERTLMHALDSAVRADLRMLRIIHGKGTGALRERVAELLRGDPRVREHRMGAWNEGGAGVTIAELR
ncbi:MAG TPA: endonuclease MutS2 [Gemmatimonadaceae bacterium]|nr:endonuclease MutS2 [Gemmatimonadaceae bacterium]